MQKKDLHDEFIDELCKKVPKRADLINLVSDILKLEKESIYRRLARKVNFSIREMGILAKELNISIDGLLYKEEDHQWLPVALAIPLKLDSMDCLCDMIEQNIKRIAYINRDAPGQMGNVYHILPLEFFIHYPMIMKFMFFKWGNYFIRSEKFNHFSSWELPHRLSTLTENYIDTYNFEKIFYIWDNSLIWILAREIDNFYKMNIITTQEKEDIKEELHKLLSNIEMTLNGTRVPEIPYPPETTFYVSSVNIGFTSNYYQSGNRHFATFQSNFSFSMIENSEEDFAKVKEWINSFCDISTLLSKSGRFERRLFFNAQYKILDDILE